MNRSSVHLIGEGGPPQTANTTHLPAVADRLAACEAQIAALTDVVVQMDRDLADTELYVYTPWPRKLWAWVRGY